MDVLLELTAMYPGYHDRLIELVRSEIKRLGCSQAEFAETLGLGRAVINAWLNRKVEGEISDGSLAALADYLNKDRAALKSYLQIGEWVAPEPSDLEKLSDRVAQLEAQLRVLSRPVAAETPADYITGREPIKLIPLGSAMQTAIREMGRDPLSSDVLWSLHGLITRPVEAGGLDVPSSSKFTVGWLQRILLGLVRPKPQQIATVAAIMRVYTGDAKWTPDYVAALLNGNGTHAPALV